MPPGFLLTICCKWIGRAKSRLVRPSQGVHVVLDRMFYALGRCLNDPENGDGRVLFAVPWHDKLVIGTTDTPLDEHQLEPVALYSEVNFILNTAAEVLSQSAKTQRCAERICRFAPIGGPAG